MQKTYRFVQFWVSDQKQKEIPSTSFKIILHLSLLRGVAILPHYALGFALSFK